MQSNAIPYQIRAKLLQLEPSLDSDWHLTVLEVLKDAEQQLCEEAQGNSLESPCEYF